MEPTDDIHRLREEIQELKEERKEASEFREKIKTILNEAGQGMWEWDQKSDLILFENSEAFWLTYLGYEADEVTYTMEWLFNNMHPQSQQDYAESITDHLSGKNQFYELEYRVKTKSGDWAWFWTRGLFTAFDEDGEPTRMIGIYRNITERREAEIELKQVNTELEQRVDDRTRQLTNANLDLQEEVDRRKRIDIKLDWARQQAEAANQSKTEFLANISHELRTPLHHILNYSKFGIEKEEKTRDQLVHYFTQIRKSSERLQILVDDLLDVSSLELGKVDYTFLRINIKSLVSEAASEMEPLCQEKSITLKIADSLVPTDLTCDGRRIEQVVYNLLSNAIRYSPENGRITVSFSGSQLGVGPSSQPALKVSIADQGIGIPDVELDTIFEAFVQSTRTRTGAGGTGLGLSICKRIISDHHGKIWASNSRGGGAVLSFLLPYEQKSFWQI